MHGQLAAAHTGRRKRRLPPAVSVLVPVLHLPINIDILHTDAHSHTYIHFNKYPRASASPDCPAPPDKRAVLKCLRYQDYPPTQHSRCRPAHIAPTLAQAYHRPCDSNTRPQLRRPPQAQSGLSYALDGASLACLSHFPGIEARWWTHRADGAPTIADSTGNKEQ